MLLCLDLGTVLKEVRRHSPTEIPVASVAEIALRAPHCPAGLSLLVWHPDVEPDSLGLNLISTTG